MEVRPALEAMTRIRVQPVPPRRPPHRHRFKPRRLHQHVRRRRRNHRVPAAHHPSQTQWLRMIGHNQVFRIERPLHAVQRLQPLALARPPHHDAPLDLVQVEDVRRLPHRQPGKVRSVDSIRDLFLFQQPKVGSHLSARKPVPRVAYSNAAQHPRRKSSARVLGLDPHRKGPRGSPRLRQREIKPRQPKPIDRRRLPRHPVVVHRIHTVGRNVRLVERPVPAA